MSQDLTRTPSHLCSQQARQQGQWINKNNIAQHKQDYSCGNYISKTLTAEEFRVLGISLGGGNSPYMQGDRKSLQIRSKAPIEEKKIYLATTQLSCSCTSISPTRNPLLDFLDSISFSQKAISSNQRVVLLVVTTLLLTLRLLEKTSQHHVEHGIQHSTRLRPITSFMPVITSMGKNGWLFNRVGAGVCLEKRGFFSMLYLSNCVLSHKA